MTVETIFAWLINTFSYLGIFISNFLVSATIIFPLPGQVIILLAVLAKLNIFLVAIASAGGSMAGELIGYYAGVLGNRVAKKTTKTYKKLEKTIKEYFSKYAAIVIFTTAFLPFPFDLVGIIAGASRYSMKKFLVIGFAGKFLKVIVFYLAIKYSLAFLLPSFGWGQ